MHPLDVSLAVFLLALVAVIWRLWAGPTEADRAAALDFGFFVFLSAVAVLAVRLDDPLLLDVVLAGALVSFLATVALARLVQRRQR